MRKLLALLLLLPSLAMAQTPPIISENTTAVTGTVGATRVLQGQAGKQIIVTGFMFVGASGSTISFTTGTGTTCGTGTSTLLPAVAVGATPLVAGGGSGGLIVNPVGQDFCVTVGTAPAPGFVTWSTVP